MVCGTRPLENEIVTVIRDRDLVSDSRHCSLFPLQGTTVDSGAITSLPTVEEEPPENDWWNEQFYDSISGAELNPKLVTEARELEVEESSWEEAKRNGCRPIPTRWVGVNKGDDRNPNIRCRLVAQETRKRSSGIADGAEGISSTFVAIPLSREQN